MGLDTPAVANTPVATPPKSVLDSIGSALSAQKLKAATVVEPPAATAATPVTTTPVTQVPLPAAVPVSQAPSPTGIDDEKKKEEAKPVQTESKVVDEAAVVATEPKKFEKERLDDFYKELEPVAEPSPVTQAPAKAELSKEEQAELAAYRALKSNPLYAAVDDVVKKGGDVRAFAQKFQSPDYDKMPSADIYKAELLKQQLSESEVAEAMEEFTDLPAHKQKLLTNPLRAQLKKEADEQTKNLLPAPDPIEQKRIAELQSKSAQEAVGSLDRLIQKAAEKGYYGYVLDKEDQQSIREAVMNNTQAGADGYSYDVASSFHQQMRMNEKIFKKMLRNATEMGEYIGYEKYIKDRVRVDKGDFAGNAGGGDGKKTILDVIRSRGIVTPIQGGK